MDSLRAAALPYVVVAPEVIHVRRPITSAEEATLPAWFNEAEPWDEAGDGVPIELP